MAPAPAPWPEYRQAPHGAPIAGHAPHHVPADQPAQQFEYAVDGFVLPGAATSQQPPMSAHGNTIGAPLQQHAPSATASHAGAMLPAMNGTAAAFDPALQQAQTWAFPTPHGMQLVQQGAAAHVPMPHQVPGLAGHSHPQQYHPGQGPALAVIHGSGIAITPSTRRRMRWETIVPGLAIACLCAAAWLLISDFDRITGRSVSSQGSSQAADPASGSSSRGQEATTTSTDDASDAVEEATELYRQGSFAVAANLLQPLLEGSKPDPAVVALHDRAMAADIRNTALLTRLANQRRAKHWAGVVATIDLLEALRPLSPELTGVRSRARAALTAARTARTRDGDRAAAATAGRATASRDRARPTPPRAGGSPGPATPAKLPPKGNAGPASIPKMPTSNPVVSPGTGAAAVGGGPGTNCHTHQGVQSCHA